MIQRIQSIFIASIALIYLSFIWIPLKSVNVDGVSSQLTAISTFNDTFSYTPTFSVVSGFVFIAILASVFALFSFKQRYLQIRICYILAVISLVCFVLLAFTSSVEHLSTFQSLSYVALILCGLATLFSLLAIVYIKKDINLLKKASRIR